MSTVADAPVVETPVATEAASTEKKVKEKKVRQPLTAEQLKEAEKDLIAKYPHVVAGTLHDIDTDPASPHYNKRTVEIRCATPGCPNTRRIATSDLKQVKYCLECTEKIRADRKKARTKASREAKKAEAATANDSPR